MRRSGLVLETTCLAHGGFRAAFVAGLRDCGFESIFYGGWARSRLSQIFVSLDAHSRCKRACRRDGQCAGQCTPLDAIRAHSAFHSSCPVHKSSVPSHAEIFCNWILADDAPWLSFHHVYSVSASSFPTFVSYLADLRKWKSSHWPSLTALFPSEGTHPKHIFEVCF